MGVIETIKSLLDQGDYLTAANLAEEHKITDCNNLFKHLNEITEIASSIEHTIHIVSSLEDRIASYESELRNVRDIAFQMEQKEHAVEIQCKNISDVSELIDELLDKLHIPHQLQDIILGGNLHDRSSTKQLVGALKKLETVLKYQPDPCLDNMKCVRNQKDQASEIKTKFCSRLYERFNDNIDYQFREFSEKLINYIYSQSHRNISLPSHECIHAELEYLAPLVHWVHENDKSTYQGIKNHYINASKTQYEREIKIFFEYAREKLASSGDTQDTISGRSSEISYSNWDEFDSYIEKMLLAIDPVCKAEQMFYETVFIDRENTTARNQEKLFSILSDKIFNVIEKEFVEFANYYASQNGIYSLYLLVRLSQHILNNTDQSSFLTQIYPEILIKVKRNFDSFMSQQLSSIRDTRTPKQSKCGVLISVKNFEQFAKQVESLFKNTGSRADIDRWYRDLVSELFQLIDSFEHSRTPTEMIRLENYYYLHDVLRSLKVPCLETQRREANLQYKAALNDYVSRYFGRPLEKVNLFFEGVQAKIAQGVKEEEISFQSAYSKQELRKVLQMVTLKEVRKGLEDMYRRIEKHAFDPNSNLIQVIWHAMQEEFLSQYKAIQGMIERCYPSSNLTLAITIDDILQVFSDIAQSH